MFSEDTEIEHYSKIGLPEIILRPSSQTTEPAYNIPGIFAECSLSVEMFGTFGKHLGNILKYKIFQKILNGKAIFVLKVYDLMITNVDLLANSNNHVVLFPEYSRNMPQMSVSKIFQGYPKNIIKL